MTGGWWRGFGAQLAAPAILLSLVVLSIAQGAVAAVRDAAGTHPKPPDQVRIDSVAALPACRPAELRGWSPRGTRLALISSEGLGVFDASHPSEPIRHLMAGQPRVIWSPDGNWIACQLRLPFRSVRVEQIVATRITGTECDTLWSGPEAWPMLWACDGNLYFWGDERPAARHALLPPPSWRREHPRPYAPRSELVMTLGFGRSGSRRSRLSRSSPAPIRWSCRRPRSIHSPVLNTSWSTTHSRTGSGFSSTARAVPTT